MEKISVIVPSYNARQTIERCIGSVVATGYRPLEIVVVDDCSTDDSPGILERLRVEFPEIVRIIRCERNGGPAKARNAGARASSAQLLFFVDSDTEMLPDALHKFAARIAEADAVVGIYDAKPLNSGLAPRYKALLNYYFFSRRGVIAYEVFDASRAGIRNKVFQEAGGFNESLGWGMDYENEEFGYRLQNRYRMVLDPAIAVRHVFPDWRKMTRTYFFRVALWVEVFLKRRRFESGGVTSAETGISSACLMLGLVILAMAHIVLPQEFWPAAMALSAVLLGVYLYGYSGFFFFVARRRLLFLVPAIVLNMYFTLAIACGAAFGVLRVILGKSQASTPQSKAG